MGRKEAAEPVGPRETFVHYRRLGYLNSCADAEVVLAQGAGQEAADRLRAACKGALLVWTNELVPDTSKPVDPETGRRPNKTQPVRKVVRCAAPHHPADLEPYDSEPEILAGRMRRNAAMGVATTATVRADDGSRREEKVGCKNGHDLAGEMPNGKPVKHVTARGIVCRLCKAEAAARHKAKTKGEAA